MDHQYIQQMKNIQNALLEFIDSEEKEEENFQNLSNTIQEQQIYESQSEMKIFFRLLMKIVDYHYRSDNFFNKIEKVILLFKKDMMSKFSNSAIYDIFQSNKRILLFLLEEKILNLDQNIYHFISMNNDYINYFYPEIKSFNDAGKYQSNYDVDQQIIDQFTNNQDDFLRKRKIGENDSYISELIRKDDIDNFISYVSKNEIPFDSKIDLSIFETNLFLLENQSSSYNNNVNLIHYASFFGSIQIFKYLYLNQAELDISVWDYAIHGDDPEIIHILEEKNLHENMYYYRSNPNLFYEKLFELSIQFFNNDITVYIQNNYLTQTKLLKTMKYMNFNYFIDYFNVEIFQNLCENGFFTIVERILKTKKIDIDKKLLFTVIKHGYLDMLALLLKSGAFNINLIEKIEFQRYYNYMNFSLLGYFCLSRKK